MRLQKLMKSLLILGVRDDHAPRLGTKPSEKNKQNKTNIIQIFLCGKNKKIKCYISSKISYIKVVVKWH
jgi:hypothetical protein